MDTSPGPLDDAALVSPDPSSTARLVMTVDVVTPMVDDPTLFGEIAAANALSDVYAMGGEPKVALSFIGFPTDKLPLETLAAIAQGMGTACARAGCAIVGGHTIVDPEPKAGLSVTGTVDRAQAWTHRGARVGQRLVLTKGIGTGIVVQAMKRQDAPDEVMRAAIESMRTLNDRARDAGRASGATSATDVTGFGLLGHLKNICEASNVTALLSASKVPLLPGARDLAARGLVPGGTKRNLQYVASTMAFASGIDEATKLLLADAQTSGGLLLCVPSEAAQSLCERLRREGGVGEDIGEIVPAEEGVHLRVIG